MSMIQDIHQRKWVIELKKPPTIRINIIPVHKPKATVYFSAFSKTIKSQIQTKTHIPTLVFLNGLSGYC